MKIIQRVEIMTRAGQETLWMNILRNCDRTEYNIDFMVRSPQKGAYDDEIREYGSQVFYEGDYEKKFKVARLIERTIHIKRFFINNPEYEVFHINEYIGIFALLDVIGAKLGNVPCIVVHSHNSDGRYFVSQRICRFIFRFINIKKAACSDKAALWMFGKTEGITIINNGIKTSKFRFDPVIRRRVRESLGIKRTEVLIGHVGKLHSQKNQLFMIDVFNELLQQKGNTTLMIVGIGSLENVLKSRVKEYGIQDKVIFYGSSDRVNELMMAMDLFLFPSLYEGLPLALVEAQTSGLKCVCSDVISEDAFLTDLIVKKSLKENARSWANTIVSELDYDRKDYADIIKEKGFDVSTTIQQVEELYSGA